MPMDASGAFTRIRRVQASAASSVAPRALPSMMATLGSRTSSRRARRLASSMAAAGSWSPAGVSRIAAGSAPGMAPFPRSRITMPVVGAGGARPPSTMARMPDRSSARPSAGERSRKSSVMTAMPSERVCEGIKSMVAGVCYERPIINRQAECCAAAARGSNHVDSNVARAGDHVGDSLVLDQFQPGIGLSDNPLVHWPGEAEALAIVDAEPDQGLDGVGSLGPLGDALHAELMGEIYNH